MRSETPSEINNQSFSKARTSRLSFCLVRSQSCYHTCRCTIGDSTKYFQTTRPGNICQTIKGKHHHPYLVELLHGVADVGRRGVAFVVEQPVGVVGALAAVPARLGEGGLQDVAGLDGVLTQNVGAGLPSESAISKYIT